MELALTEGRLLTCIFCLLCVVNTVWLTVGGTLYPGLARRARDRCLASAKPILTAL